jgi:hypothetical protein
LRAAFTAGEIRFADSFRFSFSIPAENHILRHQFPGMTFAEFKKKWSRYTGKESSAYQEHFNDLCRLLGQPTPVEADPSGTESFCFQKRVVKDAELFEIHETPDASQPTERGFADVWKKGCFAWEPAILGRQTHPTGIGRFLR